MLAWGEENTHCSSCRLVTGYMAEKAGGACSEANPPLGATLFPQPRPWTTRTLPSYWKSSLLSETSTAGQVTVGAGHCLAAAGAGGREEQGAFAIPGEGSCGGLRHRCGSGQVGDDVWAQRSRTKRAGV